MTALSIQPTFPIFTDAAGEPLENGYIWIGTTNLDPQVNPINVYWDAALTQLAAQPIRTLGGYPSNSGTPARLYVNSDYSIRVMNKNASVVYSAPAATERFNGSILTGLNAANVVYDPAGTGAVATTVQTKLRESVSVRDFGAIGNGVADDTAAIQAAVDYAGPLGVSVFIPAGVYKISAITLPQQAGGIEIFGEAYDSSASLAASIYRGSVLVSSQTTGNILSCDGGVSYNNRGIRLRNFSMRVETSGYAIYLRNSPEQNLIQNVSVHNANATASGGSGIGLESCWVGTRVDGCVITAVAAGTSNIGLNVFNALKAGGISVEDCTINKFWKGVRVGGDVYQARFVNVAPEVNTYGFYIEGNDPSVGLEQCHFELNTDIAVYIKKSGGGVSLSRCTFYRNAESASATKAEIYVSGGGSDYNYSVAIRDCNFFGVGTNVHAVYVSNSAFGSGVIENNNAAAYGTGTLGLYMGGSNLDYWEVRNNFFQGLATPYTPTSGYKVFSPALGAINQIRFSASPLLSSDPNTLDDYEEGSWTPVLSGDGGATGQSYSTQVGYYQKIGSRVYFSFSVVLTAKGSVSLEALLDGLPFTIAAGSSLAQGNGYVSDFANLGVSVVMLSLLPKTNTNKFYFRRTTAAATGMGYEFGSSLYTDTTVIRGAGSYLTNS